MGNQWKYVPLVRFLTARPAAPARVTLSLAELEGLVGPLPVAARRPTFWRDVTARRNWGRYGFSAALDAAGGTVTFTRTAPPPAASCALCARPALGDYPVIVVRGHAALDAGPAVRRPLCQLHVGLLRRVGSRGANLTRAGRQCWLALADHGG